MQSLTGKRRGYLIASLAAAFLLLILAVDQRTCDYPLNGVSDAIQYDNRLYILNDKGDKTDILCADRDGTITGRIELTKLDGDWWSDYQYLCIDENGRIYVYCYSRSMDLGELRSTVLRCDFDSETLIPEWELPRIKMLQIQVTAQAVYYPGTDSAGHAVFFRQWKDGREERLLDTDTGYGQLKGFVWHPEYGFMWTDGSCRFYRNNTLIREKNENTGNYVNIFLDERGIIYTDVKTGTVEFLGWEGEDSKVLFSLSDMSFLNPAFTYPDFQPKHYDPAGGWTAAADIAQEHWGLALFDDSGRQYVQYDTLTNSYPERVKAACKRIGAGLLLGAAVLGITKLVLIYTGGVLPILLQLLYLLIPVMILAGMLINAELKESLRKRMLDLKSELLYVLADQKLSRLNPEQLQQIDLSGLPHDLIYKELFQSVDYSQLAKEIYDQDKDNPDYVITNAYYWIFLEQEGELRYLEVDGRHYYGAAVRYERSRSEMAKMYRAMERQQIVKTEYNDASGNFLGLYVPVITAEGNCIGVMECGVNYRIIFYQIHRQMVQIHGILLGTVLVLMVILSGVLIYFLYPLSILHRAVDDISKGNLGRIVAVRGKDEVASIGQAFNEMSGQLKAHVDYIEACSERYAAFVPQKVLEILLREDITQVRLGDQREIPAAVLDISSSGFYRLARKMDGDALYHLINRMLQTMIPIISEEEGIIEHMSGDGLLAFYVNNSRRALTASVSVCERLNRMAETEPVPVYRAVIHSGKVRVGIIGEQKRMAAAAISEVMTLTAFLKEMADKYDIRILVTQSFGEEIADFDRRFHIRMLGYVYVQASQSLITVYDVFDGDPAAVRRLKEETGAFFAQALAAYLEQRYYDARLAFARVLRMNPKDLAAREYIYRCERFCQAEEPELPEIWLEQY